MVKAKVGGIVLGGLAAYLILSKGLNVVNNCVRNMCVAHEWKNYYKYGKEGNMVPPGYASHTRQINDNEEKVVESPEEQEAQRKQANNNASQKPLGATIGEAIVKVINEVFPSDKKSEEALEDQEKASEEDKNDNPETDRAEDMEMDNIVDIGVNQNTDAEE